VGNSAQDDNRAKIDELSQGADKKAAAGGNLEWRGFVLRWNTTHRINDGAVFQRQPVIRPSIIFAASEAKRQQGRVKQISRVISRKRAPSPVGATQPGGQTDYGDASVSGSERRHRRVMPIGKLDAVKAAEFS
jgi:hypothetical protein